MFKDLFSMVLFFSLRDNLIWGSGPWHQECLGLCLGFAMDFGIPGLGRSPGERNGNPLQYSCLENPMDGGAWSATVHGVTKSRTRLSDFTFTLEYWVN